MKPANWKTDPALDARGNQTIRLDDGSEHGNTDAHPVATVYAPYNGNLVAAAPELYREAQQLWKAAMQALAQLERHDRGTADAIRAEFSESLRRRALDKARGL